MSFFDIIEQVQKKPRGARIRIAAVLVIIIMASIVSVWVINLRSSLFAKNEPTNNNSVKPLTLLRDVFHDSFEGAKKEFEKLPKLTESQSL